MPAPCCVERWDRLMKEDPDMPVFTLLGSNQLAIETVLFWMSRAREVGVCNGKLMKAQQHLDALIAYRDEHPWKMQVPD